MKVTMFRLDNANYIKRQPSIYDDADVVFYIPLLAAYAVHHTKLEIDHAINIDAGYVPPKHLIRDNCVVLEHVGTFHQLMNGSLTGWLTVYHSGIKDYGLLFPHIENESLRTRLGQFSQEAESAFESQSWMSYVLMVGAVVEGILFDQFGDKRFAELISRAGSDGIIEEAEIELFNKVRALRNRIHASKHDQPFADRKTAMDLSVTYERLLKRVWGSSAALG